MSLIEITEVKKRFGSNEVLKGINIDVEPAEVIAIIGKSGSGKSTLLRCINLLEPINSGSIEVAGQEITAPNMDVNKVRRGSWFQDSFTIRPSRETPCFSLTRSRSSYWGSFVSVCSVNVASR